MDKSPTTTNPNQSRLRTVTAAAAAVVGLAVLGACGSGDEAPTEAQPQVTEASDSSDTTVERALAVKPSNPSSPNSAVTSTNSNTVEVSTPTAVLPKHNDKPQTTTTTQFIKECGDLTADEIAQPGGAQCKALDGDTLIVAVQPVPDPLDGVIIVEPPRDTQ